MPQSKSNKGKLLYIINHMDWFWSHRLPLALGAQEEGWDVSVAATNALNDKALSTQGFKGLELPPSDQGFAPFTALKITLAIAALLKKEHPTLMHAVTLKYAFLAGLAARPFGKTKVVHTIAGLGYLFSGEGFKPKMLRFFIGPFLKLALKGAHMRLIFQNPDDMDLLLSRDFARKEQCYLIRGSGVDTTQFSPQGESKNAAPVVVMPTRLVHDKGVAVFVEAARILKAKGVKARFQIAGGVTANNPLAISKNEMEKMVADGAAKWLGKVSDMPGLLAEATLIAYPSYYREGIPKVLLEACAMGKAIVTTDHPGCREAVAHGKNGLLIPPKDALTLANAIETLLNDPAKRKAMGEYSRTRALEEFDAKLIVDQTLRIYNEK